MFVSNSAGRYGGGAHFYHTSQDMQNCVLAYNEAGEAGGGIWIDLRGNQTDSEYKNLTLAFNRAESGAGIAVGRRDAGHGSPVAATVENCLFAFNAGPAYEELTGDNITTSLSCNDAYENNPNGDAETCDDCFSADPEFCGADFGIVSLAASSPCLDAENCGHIGATGVGCNEWLDSDDCETTWLEEASQLANHSQSDSLRIGAGATGLLRFSGAAVPVGATFDSAAVKLEFIRTASEPAVEARECLRAAIFSQATWLIFRLGQPWGEPGASEEGVDYSAALLGRADRFGEDRPIALGPWSSDIAKQGSVTLVLRPGGTGEVVFWSCNAGVVGPRLRVWYSE